MARPEVRVRVAFGLGADAGFPPEEQWTDVSQYVRSIDIRSGRNNDLDKIEASTCTIEFEDGDSRFHPGNTSSPYSPDVLPFAQAQVQYRTDAVEPWILGTALLGVGTYLQDEDLRWASLFTGYVMRWTPSPRMASNTGGTCSAQCVDQFRILSGDFRRLDTAFSQQSAGARVSAALTAVFLPGLADIDSGGVTLSARTVTGPALDYLQEVARVDGGLFRARPDGTLEFVARHTLQARTSWMLPQMTLGEDQGGGETGYLAPSLALDEKEIVNRVLGAASEGDPITPVEDTPSQISYLVRQMDLGTTYQADESELVARAQDLIHARAEPRLRFDGLTVLVHSSGVDEQVVLALDLFDRVEVVRRPSAGVEISGEYHIQGISHLIGLVEWQVRWNLALAPDPYWILGVSTLGETTVLGV